MNAQYKNASPEFTPVCIDRNTVYVKVKLDASHPGYEGPHSAFLATSKSLPKDGTVRVMTLHATPKALENPYVGKPICGAPTHDLT